MKIFGAAAVCSCTFVSGESVTARGCFYRLLYNWNGCKSSSFRGHSGIVCVCDTDLCNGAVMTSSIGHVTVVVTLLVNAIIAYLL